ncbi:MAG: shikimate kinase [Chitinophagaceae bacterium]|nr:shikimate kinase [Chitinophagaceae bacterium]
MKSALHNSPFRGPGGKIFLIGFMGSGKTYWGNIWAKQSGLAFYDLDEVIEKEQHKTIAAIFENDGEAHFRKIETVALKSFTEKNDCIIACGGGTACFHENMLWMNANGTTIYLSATPQYIFDRVLDDKEKRPLIKKHNEAELIFFIEQKLKEREPFYNQAQIILPVTELNEESLSTFNY